MKKLIAIIAFACYFAASCGVIMDFHFCMNRLSSVHLFKTSVDRCARCGMKMHEADGCCRDEVKVVKLQQDQNKIPVISYQLPVMEQPVVTPSSFMVAVLFTVDDQRHFHNHSPPLLSEQDSYIKNRVFRI